MKLTERLYVKRREIMKRKIKNPEKIMEEVKKELSYEINVIKDKFGVDYLEIREYLNVNLPDLNSEIEELYDLIDSDILTHYKKDKLSVRQYNSWKKNVEKWKGKMIEGFVRYVEYECLSLVA